jgi:hypothetical protein
MAAKNQDASVAGTAWYEISMIGNGQQPAKKLVKVNRWTKAVVSALLAASSENDSQASSQASEDGDSPVQTAKLEKLKALMAQPRTKRLVVVCPKSTNYGKGDLKAFLDEHFIRNYGNTDCTVEIRGRIRKQGYKFRDNSNEFKIDDYGDIDEDCFPSFEPEKFTNGQPDVLCDEQDWDRLIREEIEYPEFVKAHIEDFDSAWANFKLELDGDEFDEWTEKESASKSSDSAPSDSTSGQDSTVGKTTADDSVQAKPSKTKHPDSPTSPTSPVASMPDDDQHLHKIMRKTC